MTTGAEATQRRSTDPRDYQAVARPVAAMAKEFTGGFFVAPHRHRRAQLVYAAQGIMRVAAPGGAWTVPPLRAVWIPPDVEHEIRMLGAVAMRTLYLEPDTAVGLRPGCGVIEVSSLLRELILGLLDEPVDYAPGSKAALIEPLILHELKTAPAVPLGVVLPRDKRLLALCRALLDEPAATDTLESWAERVGASSRTLVRLFRRETGLSFAAWRQQARLVEAVALLSLGQPVGDVARQLGYGSASAFAAMFRRTLGDAPRHYLAAARPPGAVAVLASAT